MPNPFTLKSFKTFVWEAVYIIFLSIILANYWVGFYLGRISILPLIVPLTYFMASICGFLAYLFIKSIRRAFYATILICVLACIITALSLFMPAYLGVVDMEVSIYISLRVAIIMFIYVFPFGMGGCMVAAYLFPD